MSDDSKMFNTSRVVFEPKKCAVSAELRPP